MIGERMKKIALLAVFYFFSTNGQWSQVIGPFNSSNDCNVVRSWARARGIGAVSVCWSAPS